ncbi:MAG: superoxide dismutase [Phycisphaerae bacterium]|nr:superoxide dismutase [Phycisphaerae bacterium]
MDTSTLHDGPPDRSNGFDRRRFLLSTAALVAASGAISQAGGQAPGGQAPAAPATGSGGAAPAADGPFTLDPLPYPPEALEPFIDAETMKIHHGKHHAAYVKNLNAAMKDMSPLVSLRMVLKRIDQFPADRRTALRNNGGGHVNHTLFWNVLAPKGSGGEPSKELVTAIESDLGGMTKFQEAISAKAMGQFGSGWAWLIVTPERKLAITSTPNQDSPIMQGVVEQVGTPIFGIDVWEHAYYLKYQNKRADYVKAVLELINWKTVSGLYAGAAAG